MTFSENARINPGRVQRRGRGTTGSKRGAAAGGGLGGLLLILLIMFLGGDPSSLGFGDEPGSGVEAPSGETQAEFDARCTTDNALNEYQDCRIAGAVASLDGFWMDALPAAGFSMNFPGVVVFDSATDTACGTASSQTGPFYCPSDEAIYADTTFFAVLESEFKSQGGPLGEMYVIAHEYGHHLENEMGIFSIANRSDSGPQSDSVKVELMADCLAGVWMAHASTVPDANGNPLLLPFTENDVRDALSAAGSVGDDNIQEIVTGQVEPHTFTHGTSAEREEALLHGMKNGTIASCDLFGVTR